MAWLREAITDGEIDALRRAALSACAEDTRYPQWRGSSVHGGGECLNMAQWLVGRLGGSVGVKRGHYVWLSPDSGYAIDLTGGHTGSATYAPNHGFQPYPAAPTPRAQRFAKRASRVFDALPRLMRLGLALGEDTPAPIISPQYVAGLFDGEGCLTLYTRDSSKPGRPRYVVEASVGMTDRRAIDHLCQVFGGTVVEKPSKNANWKTRYDWKLSSADALLTFIDYVAPHAVIKSGQLGIGREFLESKLGRGKTSAISDDELAFYEECRRRLGVLNKKGLDNSGEAYPAETPRAETDREQHDDSWTSPEHYWHDETDPVTPEGVYTFIYANGQLEVSPNHSHDELSEHAGIDPTGHTGPFAAGHVVLTSGRATWEVQANVNLHSFLRILKDASKDYGWTWGGMTDAQGQPIIEAFGPKKSFTTLNYVYLDDHLYLGSGSAASLVSAVPPDPHGAVDAGRPLTGHLRLEGSRATVDGPLSPGALRDLFGFAEDNQLRLYAGNDNVIKTIPDLQEGNTYAPDPAQPDNPVEQSDDSVERNPAGLYSCPGCHELLPNWLEYSQHRRECAEWSDPDRLDGGERGFPQPDPGLYGDGAHFHEMRQEPGITTGAIRVLPARTFKEAARVDGFARYARAFRYDNDNWSFYVAYRDGNPLGYAVMGTDGNLQMLHVARENEGIGRVLLDYISVVYDDLYTHTAQEKSASILKRRGWVHCGGQKWRWSRGTAPTDMLDGPVPFIFDVDKDTISVGHPGSRTSDIPGQFTPGGIVEGFYEPGGKVIIKSLTSTPYTIRHLVELWYYTHPHLEVKSVHLEDAAGKKTKLATTLTLAVVENPAAYTAWRSLQRRGGIVYVVGGAVRDACLDLEPNDVDLVVAGLPAKDAAKTLKMTGAVKTTGNDFAVMRYHQANGDVEIAIPRTDRSTGAGHTAFEVTGDPDLPIEADLARRDFTVNAMAFAPSTHTLIDPYGGQADLTAGVLRTITSHSLSDDPLRLVRGLVLHARYGLTPDPDTRAQMLSNAGGLEHLSAERVQWELDKLFAAKDPAGAIRLAHDVGALAYLLPEVDRCFDYDQNNPHHELELGGHLLNVLARIAEVTDDKDLRLAALLHDIGKPSSAWTDPETGRSHFYAKKLDDGTWIGANHEECGADLARARLTALKYPKDRIERICRLIFSHMYAGFSTTAGARRFLNRVRDDAEDLFLLRWADQGGKSEAGHLSHDKAWNVDHNRRLVAQVREAGEAVTPRDLALTGHHLITAGHRPGPKFTTVLDTLMTRVIEDPSLNTVEQLMPIAEEILAA